MDVAFWETLECQFEWVHQRLAVRPVASQVGAFPEHPVPGRPIEPWELAHRSVAEAWAPGWYLVDQWEMYPAAASAAAWYPDRPAARQSSVINSFVGDDSAQRSQPRHFRSLSDQWRSLVINYDSIIHVTGIKLHEILPSGHSSRQKNTDRTRE